MRTTFVAPWGRAITLISLGISALLVAVAWLAAMQEEATWVAVLPIAILLGAAAFAILGYRVEADAVIIRRPGWTTRLPLSGLVEVEAMPGAMKRSLRTFGNGGLFGFSGRYRNRRLGAYRAWVTDRRRMVVLRFLERTIVLSPDDPQAFVEAVRTHLLGGG